MRTLITVSPDFDIDITDIPVSGPATDELTREYPDTLRKFEVMRTELEALLRGQGDSTDFIKKYGRWLLNLSQSGFALEHAQFVKK